VTEEKEISRRGPPKLLTKYLKKDKKSARQKVMEAWNFQLQDDPGHAKEEREQEETEEEDILAW